MKRILLHICCGPCAIYPLRRLDPREWNVHGYFYNPFIQPYREWQKRLETLESFARQEELRLIVRRDYDPEGFFRSVAFRERERCLHCYSLRLEAAARLAKKSGFDAFTTTLLYGKRQKHDLIRSIATEASRKYGIPFHYEDYRAGWREGQQEASERGLYKQEYCGCLYSEKERFWKENRPPEAEGE
jgi:hypothetical protein